MKKAESFLLKGDVPNSKKQLLKILKIDSENAPALEKLAIVYIAENDYQGMVDACMRARKCVCHIPAQNATTHQIGELSNNFLDQAEASFILKITDMRDFCNWQLAMILQNPEDLSWASLKTYLNLSKMFTPNPSSKKLTEESY